MMVHLGIKEGEEACPSAGGSGNFVMLANKPFALL